MPTTILSGNQNDVKIRFNETYVSSGLNRKLNGVVPRGVVRGGKLSTSGSGFGVTINEDPDTGDSIYSYIDANGHQFTFRQSGAVVLDLTAESGNIVYIALYIEYVIGTAGVVVEWRAYSESELFGGSPVSEADDVIVLGRVNVSASPIPASDVTPLQRREGWDAISKALIPWTQVVENPRFDFAKVGTITGNTLVGWRGYDLVSANHTWSIGTASPRSGLHELGVNGSGSTGTDLMEQHRVPSVGPGDFVRVQCYVRGSSWSGVGASGAQGIRLTWADGNLNSLGTTYITDNSLSGTFSYTKIEEIVEAPAGSEWVLIGVIVDPDGTSLSGDLFFDDISVWVQSDVYLSETKKERELFGYLHSRQVDLVGISSDISDTVDGGVSLYHDGYNVGNNLVSLIMKRLGSAGGGFDLDAENMGIQIQRLIKALGGSLLSTGADARTPRITSNYAPSATSDYTLMWEMPPEGGGDEYIRMYAAAGPIAPSTSFVITINASWDGTQWNRDVASTDALRFDVARDRVLIMFREGTLSDGWSDGTAAWGQELKVTYVSSFGGGLSIETDGRFRYSGGVQSFNRPSSSKAIGGSLSVDPVSSGVLYANSVVKAYGVVETDGLGDLALHDGLNINGISIDGSGNLSVTLYDAFATSKYCVHVTGQNGSTITGVSLNETISSFDLDIKQIGGANVNLSSEVAHFCFTVTGRNP